MLSKDQAEQQASQPANPANTEPAATEVPLPDPWHKIETAATGNGTVNDPGGSDNKPPGVSDLDPLSFLA